MDISGKIDMHKKNVSKESGVYHCWYFLDYKFNYEPHLCNSCHDVTQKLHKF